MFLAYSDLVPGLVRPILQVLYLEINKLPTKEPGFHIWARKLAQKGSQLPRFAESAGSDSNHPYLVSNNFDAGYSAPLKLLYRLHNAYVIWIHSWKCVTLS